METVAKEHREASLRQQEHRAEKDKAAPKATLGTDKCDQVWADLEHAAFQLEEAVKAGKSADILALMAMEVRRAKAEFGQMVTAISKTAADAAAGGAATASAQEPMEVDAAERKRPLEESSRSKTNDDDDDEPLPARQARRQEPVVSVNETQRERSRSPR